MDTFQRVRENSNCTSRQGQQSHKTADWLLCINPSCTRHQEEKRSPFTKKYEDTAQIHRYKIKTATAGLECSLQATSKVRFFNYTRKRRRAKDNAASIRNQEGKLLADGWEMAGLAVLHTLYPRKNRGRKVKGED